MKPNEGRRVLTVLPDFPLPATTGLHLRMMGNLDAVGRASERSSVLWFSTADRLHDVVDTEALRRHCDEAMHAGARVEQHDMARWRLALSKIRFVVTGVTGRRASTYPYAMRYDAAGASGAIAAAIDATASNVVVLPSQGMHWIDACPDDVDVIIDAADVLTDVTRSLAATHAGSFIGRIGLWANHLAHRAQERAYLPRAVEVWATTAREAERFGEIAPSAHTVVVPNTVPTPAAAAIELGSTATNVVTIGMIATWSYRPNLDALVRLIDRIMPRLLASDVPIALVIAGRDLPAEIERRMAQEPRFTSLGPVNDIADFYSAVDIAALPIDVRGGVPLKLAEAMAMATPVVATPQLVEGLQLVDGEQLIVANDDTAFAAAILELADDPHRRAALAAAAQVAQAELFSAAAIDEALAKGSVLCR